MRKIDELNFPPTIGEYYLVPCIVKEQNENLIDEDEYYREERLEILPHKFVFITPVFNNYHNDISTGQHNHHYHHDSRWSLKELSLNNKQIIGQYSGGRFNSNKLEYFVLKCISNTPVGNTPSTIFKNIKFPKCMKNNKCVHKQFNMNTVVEDENGIKTCPLHGLQYRKNKLITNAI